MSTCYITIKDASEISGKSIQTIRRLVKAKKVKFKSEELKRVFRLNVSNSGVRSVDKKGSFDQFIKDAKSKNLSLRLKKIKKSLLSKSV